MLAHSSHRVPYRCFPTHPIDRVDQMEGPQPETWRVLQPGPVVPDIVDIAASLEEAVRAAPERPMTTPVSRPESPVTQWLSFAFVLPRSQRTIQRQLVPVRRTDVQPQRPS